MMRVARGVVEAVQDRVGGVRRYSMVYRRIEFPFDLVSSQRWSMVDGHTNDRNHLKR
jgi:hypothetical protein